MGLSTVVRDFFEEVFTSLLLELYFWAYPFCQSYRYMVCLVIHRQNMVFMDLLRKNQVENKELRVLQPPLALWNHDYQTLNL
jgi:hypothetical protein